MGDSLAFLVFAGKQESVCIKVSPSNDTGFEDGKITPNMMNALGGFDTSRPFWQAVAKIPSRPVNQLKRDPDPWHDNLLGTDFPESQHTFSGTLDIGEIARLAGEHYRLGPIRQTTLLVASDGIEQVAWENLADVCGNPGLNKAETVLKSAIHGGSRDNLCAVTVDLSPHPRRNIILAAAADGFGAYGHILAQTAIHQLQIDLCPPRLRER